MNYKYVIICFWIVDMYLYLIYILRFTFYCNTANVCVKHQSINP